MGVDAPDTTSGEGDGAAVEGGASCEGVPICPATEPDEFECETLNEGCSFTADQCTGTPSDCKSIDEEACKENLTCSWIVDECRPGGVVSSCEELPKLKDTCQKVQGCFWVPATCEGTPQPCSAATSEVRCGQRSGCSWTGD